MKTTFCKNSVTVLSFLIFFSLSLQAQLKVLSSGRVEIYNQHVITGTINTDVLDLVNSATNLGSGYDLIWGKYVSTQPNNPGLLKLVTEYSTKFVVKANGYTGICKSSPTCELDVVGTGRINGSLILTSDERLKENILPVSNASTGLLKLTGVQYNLKSTTEDMDFEGKDYIVEKDSVMMRKNIADPEFYSRKHIGFLAQDVREFFPDLVFEDDSGILSIDYIGLIPVIVETLKEQQRQISILQNALMKVSEK
jgi:hypothetical protein